MNILHEDTHDLLARLERKLYKKTATKQREKSTRKIRKVLSRFGGSNAQYILDPKQ